MTEQECQRWDLAVRGVRHRVEIRGSFSRTIDWYVDDRLVAQKKSSDDTIQLQPGDVVSRSGSTVELTSDDAAALGVVGVKFTSLGRPKRVTWYESDGEVDAQARALLGAGGLDLDPEPGSSAALRDDRIRLHPRRHAAIAVGVGVAKVLLPVLLGLMAVRLAISIPWPRWDLPSIPWPDWNLPSIPWPDLPSIPWPDVRLPDWDVPGWVRWLADKVKFVWPVVLAWAIARSEINRRRKQDALKAALRADALADTGSATPVAGSDPTSAAVSAPAEAPTPAAVSAPAEAPTPAAGPKTTADPTPAPDVSPGTGTTPASGVGPGSETTPSAGATPASNPGRAAGPALEPVSERRRERGGTADTVRR